MGFKTFSNGWIGVDIFFVISGFLMWHLYVEKVNKKSFALFYIKRFKRLLPALSITILVTGFGFLLRLPVPQRESLIDEIFVASLGVSNLYYWLIDQHSSNADLRPLITLWSISLELQFYLIFPLIVLFVKNSILKLVLLISLSFVAFVTLGFYAYETKLYTLPGKLWEFFLGMLAAEILRRYGNPKKGFYLLNLLFAVFMFVTLFVVLNDRSRMMLQVFGAIVSSLLMIYSFQSINKNALVQLLAKIGDYSYSVYLLHFPLFVFIGYSEGSGNPVTLGDQSTLILYLVILAISSWVMKRYIEDSTWLRGNYLRIFLTTLFATTTLYISKSSVLNF
jgi:peptidoglycan/LPS O-acetylase OafA/YrhL